MMTLCIASLIMAVTLPTYSGYVELPKPMPKDPWGRPYVFLNIIDDQPNKDAARKDGILNPLNTVYDPYSQGEDGDSKGPLNAKASRDDIVRANNGSHIGLGEDC